MPKPAHASDPQPCKPGTSVSEISRICFTSHSNFSEREAVLTPCIIFQFDTAGPASGLRWTLLSSTGLVFYTLASVQLSEACGGTDITNFPEGQARWCSFFRGTHVSGNRDITMTPLIIFCTEILSHNVACFSFSKPLRLLCF